MSTVVDMTLKEKDLQALAQARDAHTAAEVAVVQAAQDRSAAIRRAADNGATLREIGDAVGLSHQMIHKMLGVRATMNPEGCLFTCDTLHSGVTYHTEGCPNAQ